MPCFTDIVKTAASTPDGIRRLAVDACACWEDHRAFVVRVT
jgi:hypothetical protein